jgi:hypothetical protein
MKPIVECSVFGVPFSDLVDETLGCEIGRGGSFSEFH